MMRPRYFNAALACALSFLSAASCQKPPTTRNTGSGVAVTGADGKIVNVPDSSRVVSVGTATTETIYALGAGAKLVGVDNSSAEYVAEAARLPRVGPRATLSAEGILSLKPTLVVLTADAGPPQVVEQLRGANVAVVTLTSDYTVATVLQKVRTIARALALEQRGSGLEASIERDMNDVGKLLAGAKAKPKVMFVGRGPNMPNATMSGAGTTVDEMIKLAGGVNPLTDFKGFREMTDEAVVNAAPDVILLTEKSFERSGGTGGVLKFPGVALTPAGKDRRVYAVSDMYFQGFGPGVGRAVRELALKLHPELGGSNTSTPLDSNTRDSNTSESPPSGGIKK
jgi:iron complex transport system substrate-binding protein